MGAILVVEPDPALAEQVGIACRVPGIDHCVVADDVARVGRKVVEDADLRIAVLGTGVAQDAGLEFARTLSAARPDVSVLLLADKVTTDLLRRSLRAGLSDVVQFSPGRAADLAPAVVDALARAEQSRHAESDDESTGAVILTVLSTKGGVGKSVIASNLAVCIAKTGKSVALVDLDLTGGDIGIMMQMKPDRTIADAALQSDHLDEEMLRAFLVEHPSGTNVLLAPAQPSEAGVVSAPRLARVLDLLASMYDVVVVDTPSHLDDRVVTAVDRSDAILVVATMDVPSVKDTRQSLQNLRELGYANGSIRLLLNRADSRVWLEAEEVERATGLPIFAKIPSDRLVPRSVNKGVPVVMEAPRSAVAKSLAEMAVQLVSKGGAS